MLGDPLYLQRLPAVMVIDTDSTNIGGSRIVDVAPGKSVRVLKPCMGGVATLSISHSESKENKGQITDRSAIRFEVTRTSDEGVDVTAQATVTISSPRTGFTAAEVQEIVLTLIGTLIVDNNVGDAGTTGITSATLQRILAGEP